MLNVIYLRKWVILVGDRVHVILLVLALVQWLTKTGISLRLRLNLVVVEVGASDALVHRDTLLLISTNFVRDCQHIRHTSRHHDRLNCHGTHGGPRGLE